MLTLKSGSNKAIIVLHEIYGINQHIVKVCEQYHAQGYDAFCPDLLGRGDPYDYAAQNEAYAHFVDHVKFGVSDRIVQLAGQLRPQYERLFIVGYSVGATIAWICAGAGICDGVVCYYGSRIRDHVEIGPECPVLLILAEGEPSFTPTDVAIAMKSYPCVEVSIFSERHGFFDPFCLAYDSHSAEEANKLVGEFLDKLFISKVAQSNTGLPSEVVQSNGQSQEQVNMSSKERT